ncbi:hypothetical protein KAR91_29470 [Candidatus Pacearchaeota archaeon]|nr:hypothetical protein [Candidatus Pacearchaeota archaeon]
MEKDRRDTIITQFNWGNERPESTEAEVELPDSLDEEAANLIKSVRARPSFKAYMALIDFFLEQEEIDKAEIAVKSFSKWNQEQKK